MPLVHDPLGHIKISVSNVSASKTFYDKLFQKIGLRKVADYPDSAGWKTSEGFGFWMEQAEKRAPTYVFGRPGLHHLCFKAPSRQKVDALYTWLLKEHAAIYDAPAAYPEYTKTYYAVFFADPDDIKLEYAYY